MRASSANAPSTDRPVPAPPSPRPSAPVCIQSLPGLDTVRRLQHVRGYPAVSLLLSAAPKTLGRLVAEAEQRLRSDCDAAEAAEVRARLRWLRGDFEVSETDEAVGVFVHARHLEIVRLPAGVRDRVVVADTFATSDVVRAFRHAPRYVLLLLADEAATLYDGSGRTLAERSGGDRRVLNPWRGATPLPVGFDVDASVARSGRQRAYLRRVDDALDQATAGFDLPVVLAGPRHLTAAFLAMTTQPERLVGVATSGDTALDVLGRLAHRLIDNHTAREEQKAVAELQAAHAQGRVAAGMAEVWPAALRGEGTTLLVEEPCSYAARLTGDGLDLRPAPPEGGRGIVADVIGELAWAVTLYGGTVVVVPEGTLRSFDRIALIVAGKPGSR